MRNGNAAALGALAVGGCLTALVHTGSPSAPIAQTQIEARRLPFVQTARKATVRITPVSLASVPTALELDLNRSMKARRALAWDIVQRVWTPVGSPGAQVPAWMTWYEEEDIERLYREMMADSSRPSTPAQVASRVAAVMSRNPDKDLQASLSSARLGRVLRQFTFPEFTALGSHAKPGTGSIFYNPAYVTHLLANAERIAGYDTAAFEHQAPGVVTSVNPRLQINGPATANANTYALSMDREMPADALMIKVDWIPVEQGATPYHTEGSGLAKGFKESRTGNFDVVTFPNSNRPFTYGINTPDNRTGAARMIVVADEKGQRWALMGMHIASKVRRTWVWITFMWQGSGVPEWQADRPDFFKQYQNAPEPWLTWPLHQYGMAVASDFKEGDPRPWAAFDRVPEANAGGPNADLHAMSKTLKDLAGAMNGLQWCANPYIEVGMSHTNCIGCHQGSPNEFLSTTLTRVRNTNVGDFSFSIATNRQTFIRVMQQRASGHAASAVAATSRRH